MKRLVVSDVDGTITDLEEGAYGFNRAFLAAMARVLQMRVPDLGALVEEAMQLMDAEPGKYGWMVEGEIVAPATADPFVRMRTAAEVVFDRQGLMRDRSRREEWLDRTFERARLDTETIFKQGVLSFLALMDQHNGVFVTNSDPQMMEGRFNGLAAVAYSLEESKILTKEFATADEVTRQDVSAMLMRCRDRVHGNAGRQFVEPMLQVCVPELSIPGLERPVLLHRGRYYRLLRQLLQEAGVDWKDLWVVGDIFELDLAMAWQLGANVVMIDNGVMPDYERRFLHGRDRVHVTETLSGAGKILF